MRKYYREIIFTKVPLRNLYRFKDVFQIFPAKLDNMPETKMQRHHPNILEYWISDEDTINVTYELEEMKDLFPDAPTQINKVDKILRILSISSNNLFFKYNVEHLWGIPILKEPEDSDEWRNEANGWSSKWCRPIFFFPQMPEQLQISGFSDIDINGIPTIEHGNFYFHEPSFDRNFDDEIYFPNTMDHILEKYFSLNAKILRDIDFSISHCYSSIELMTTKKTLSVLSAFTAVETMVNLEFVNEKVEKCNECGQPRYSIVQKFRTYLLKYLGDTKSNRTKFNKFYSLRSKIIHRGEMFSTEKLFNDATTDKKKEEFLTQIEIIQLAKLSIIHWLLKN